MKYLAIIFAAGISLSAFADFNSDTEPFRPANGTSVYGMKIVNSLPSQSGLAKIGVRKGDIVLSWNHRNIADNTAALEAYNEKNVKAAHVIRDGHSKFLKELK